VPGTRSRKRKIRHDKRRYKERWRIEATFCRLKDFRRIATSYDKLARNYASAVALAAVLPRHARRVRRVRDQLAA
jgi:transposase